MDEESANFTEDDYYIPPVKYEYLDHTADVQLHAWGDTLKEAFEQCGMAMFGYMTELEYVEIKEVSTIEANADDMMGLLYHFLDELLYLFCVEPNLICRKIVITDFNVEEFKIVCKCYGEEFRIGKHPQGTEVKAITYSAMQIIDDAKDNKYEVYVIIDI
ncbi:protein archease-like [Achroia grisella]|uniref:protein archease-like n=1 Tax=Achroia grisella TaxID=688607 RepID=UPI0027D2D54F|nr:protein archease-like [Achroia grisella]